MSAGRRSPYVVGIEEARAEIRPTGRKGGNVGLRTRSGGASRTWPRAGFTQPERRIVSIEGDAAGIGVITTSQKLAHRVVNELKKAFGGRASYAWSDRDGSLFATWKRDDTPS